MPAKRLDHVNIATDRVEDTADFFARVLGLKAIAPSENVPPQHGRWLLDDEGNAVIHLARPDLLRSAGHPTGPGGGSGSIHHVAFACEDYEGMLARLESEGRVEGTFAIEAMNLRQIFIRDPNGILLELNFTGA